MNAASPEQQIEALAGRWSLVGWTGRDEEGRPVAHGGERPIGDLIYLRSGRMSVQIQHDARPLLGSRELEAGNAEGRARAFGTYIAYAGRFSLPEPGVVVHHVEVCLRPDQVGIDKRRGYSLAGDELTLRTQPVLSGGRRASSELRWRLAERL